MPRKLEELTATWMFEKFRFESGNGDLLIGDAVLPDEGNPLGGNITIKCNEEDEHPQRYGTYRFYGYWTNYTNKRNGQTEKQFQAKTFVKCQPHGRAGIIAYLAKAPNVGRVIASRLWEKFGGNAVKILREQPKIAAAAVKRLSDDAAKEAAEFLDRDKKIEACTIDLVDLLDGRGFPKQTAKEAVKEFGNQAAERIKQNPYILMRFRGCGFKRADALYLDLGLSPTSIKRQALCAWYSIASRSTGDTWHYIDVAKRSLDGSIGGASVQTEKAIRLAVRGRALSLVYTDGQHGSPSWDGDWAWLADERKARNERRLARLVAQCLNEHRGWADVDFSFGGLSEHQQEKAQEALQAALAILIGSPGTGKTYVAAQLIKELLATYSAEQIGIAAPTGKAAVRLTEGLAAHKLPLRARTIHSMLGVDSADGGWTFKHNAGNPLEYKVLVIDEVSMLDTDLAASLFAARARGTLVLLIGDTNQLPPVGHGAPLRDLLAAGVPHGELKEIQRNSGGIVECCAAIRDTGQFVAPDPDGSNLILYRTSDAQKQIETMTGLLKSSDDPVWSCQVLCAVNKNSELARKKLNKILQGMLNTNRPVTGSPFRLADKVVNTQNGWYPKQKEWQPKEGDEEVQINEKDQVYVTNGELGEVIDVAAKYMVVRLATPERIVVVPRGEASEGDDGEDSTGTGCNWDLGYALSVHKFQGSEVRTAIVMLDSSPAAGRVCTREWLYTAISRAKECCYLIGSEGTAASYVRRTALDKRKTFLREWIGEEVAEAEREVRKHGVLEGVR